MWTLLQQLIAFVISLFNLHRPLLGDHIAASAGPHVEPIHPKVVTAAAIVAAKEKEIAGFQSPAAKPAPSSPSYGKFAPFDGPLTHRPKNRAGVIQMFGDPTRRGLYLKVVDPKWMKASIVEAHEETAFLPVLAPSYFPVHKLIEPYAREAFRRAEAACPGYIHRKGTWGFNFRHMRHIDMMPLSYHSYGIAIDVNPDDNQAHEFAPGKRPKPWSKEWTDRWPHGVPQGVVDAFKSCGFSWGGDWDGYCDPMHFEWLGRTDVQV